MSEALKRAIADELNLHPTADGDGYAWQVPAELDAAVIAEAGTLAGRWGAELAAAPIGTRLHWLTKLAVLTAGAKPVEDVRRQIAEYAPGLNFPPLCFTDETRFACARKFKWWPAYAELAAALDEIAAGSRERLRRLNRVAASPVPEAPPLTPDTVRPDWHKRKRGELTAAERQLFDADAGPLLERCRQIVGAA